MKLRIGWHTTQQIDNNASNILFVRREVFFKKSILFIKQHSFELVGTLRNKLIIMQVIFCLFAERYFLRNRFYSSSNIP